MYNIFLLSCLLFIFALFSMLLYISCIYLSFYFNVHIIVVGLYCYVCFPRWVLDHLLGYVWEVPLGGRNLIPPRHLRILLLMLLFYVISFTFKQPPSSFIFCCPIYFRTIPILFYFMLFHLLSTHLLSSNPHSLLFYVIPFYFFHVPSLPLFYCAHTHIYIHTISRHLNNKKDFLLSF